MIFRVRHLTAYRYSDSVLLSHHAAHLRPRPMDRQRIDEISLRIDPLPAVLDDGGLDYFGNPITFFTIQDPHATLSVVAEFQVETSPSPDLSQIFPMPWEQVATELASHATPHLAAAMDFMFPSTHVPMLSEARDFALASFSPGRPLLDAVLDLNHRIFTEFTFDSSATTVGTPLAQVFADKRGVCQDFAHAGIACLRAMGLAARYVSGYIRTLPPPGKEKLIGADASHAWLSVFLPNWGWLDVDPTNDMLAGHDHVVVGWGRDYDDISPLKGVVLGGGTHQIHVSVDVMEL